VVDTVGGLLVDRLAALRLAVPVLLGLVVGRDVHVVVGDLVASLVGHDGDGVVDGGLVDEGGGVVDDRDLVVDDRRVVHSLDVGGVVRSRLVVQRSVGMDGRVVVDGGLVSARAVSVLAGTTVMGNLVMSVRGVVVRVVGLVVEVVVALALVVLIVGLVFAEGLVALIRVGVAVIIGGVARRAVVDRVGVGLVAVVGLVVRGVVHAVRVGSPVGIGVVGAHDLMTVGAAVLAVAVVTVGVSVLAGERGVVRVLGLGVVDGFNNGGVAVGVLTNGGVAVGVLTNGGVAVGVLTNGGVAVGVVAVGVAVISVHGIVDNRGVDGLVDNIGDNLSVMDGSVGVLLGDDGFVPAVLGGDVSVVVGIEVNLRVSVLRLLVVAGLPVLGGDVGNLVLVDALDVALGTVLGPAVLAGHVAAVLTSEAKTMAVTVSVASAVG
jgi:hypothetical protein